MVCHATNGSYDFEVRREQISEQNFAWAPTAALHLGTIDGSVSRIRDGSDPEDEATRKKLPKVTYDADRFGPDGTVFFDLVRQPQSNACYQCHSSRLVMDAGIEDTWIHDKDVHLQAGMDCADCHRNGIGHHIVRGFEGEVSLTGQSIETLSCVGCHLGTQPFDTDGEIPATIPSRAGRLGSPQPAHAGLPLVHFEKLSCTACHGGPVPRDEALRVMTSLAHGLGEDAHRTGEELPAILAPVFTRGDDGKVYPQRAVWPAFWGSVVDGSLHPLPPTKVYNATRRALRVRNDFISEVVRPEPSRSELRDLLGEERAKLDSSEWTPEEAAKVEVFRSAEGEKLFNEKVYAALQALEDEFEIDQAVYVSTGVVYVRGEEADTLTELTLDPSGDSLKPDGAEMVTWPIAHPVRPAGWSLGVAGCTECHSDTGRIFTSTVQAAGPGPHLAEPISMRSLQGVDADQRLQWNQLFGGRASFKYMIAASLLLLCLVLLVGIGAKAAQLAMWTADKPKSAPPNSQP